MKLRNKIFTLACLTSVLVAGPMTGNPALSRSSVSELKPEPDTATSKFFRIKPFHLDIIAPSSGVQFYKNEIIFLSHGKSEEKVPDKHISFGSIKTFMAPVLDTVPGNFQPFLSSSKVFPSEAATFTEDFKSMYLSLIPAKGNKEKIFRANLRSDNWIIEDEPLNFSKKDFLYTHPTVSTDGTLIVFSSDMPDARGGLDLYVTRKEGEKWSDPANLGKQINSQGNELFASLDSRNNLYFSSDGLQGEGGYDVFVCPFNGTGWDQPQNLGGSINSNDDEVAFTVNRTYNRSAFFTSRPISGKGKSQLYIVALNPALANGPESGLSDHIMALAGVKEQVYKAEAVVPPPAQKDSENVEQKPTPTTKEVKPKTVEPASITARTQEAKTPANKPATVAPSIENKDVVIYRVQIITNTKPVGSQNIIVAGKTYKSFEYLYKGGYRTTIGEYKTMGEAARLQSICRQNGYSQAFVVAFKNNIRSTDPALFK